MPRRAAVWYRTARDEWFTTIGGKQTPLGVKGRENKEAAEAARQQRIAKQSQPLPPPPGPTPPTEENDNAARRLIEQPARIIITLGSRGTVLYVKTVPSIGDHISIPSELAPNGVATVVEVTGRRWQAVRLPSEESDGVLPSIALVSVKPVVSAKTESK